jgi:hypothetical protein
MLQGCSVFPSSAGTQGRFVASTGFEQHADAVVAIVARPALPLRERHPPNRKGGASQRLSGTRDLGALDAVCEILALEAPRRSTSTAYPRSHTPPNPSTVLRPRLYGNSRGPNPHYGAPEDLLTFRIMQLPYSNLDEEQIRVKLAQFPNGSKFYFQMYTAEQMGSPVSPEKQQAVLQGLRTYAAQFGVTIEERSRAPYN